MQVQVVKVQGLEGNWCSELGANNSLGRSGGRVFSKLID
jgi:hypothetical protein